MVKHWPLVKNVYEVVERRVCEGRYFDAVQYIKQMWVQSSNHWEEIEEKRRMSCFAALSRTSFDDMSHGNQEH
ncbi:hypothetical protein Sjap_001412 [Stephania japonica]|uniref:Uncharacterized protein n=1 Tax=Stephania japonica TaxID=461633 RepID=A0AAP0KM75_9MAGN